MALIHSLDQLAIDSTCWFFTFPAELSGVRGNLAWLNVWKVWCKDTKAFKKWSCCGFQQLAKSCLLPCSHLPSQFGNKSCPLCLLFSSWQDYTGLLKKQIKANLYISHYSVFLFVLPRTLTSYYNTENDLTIWTWLKFGPLEVQHELLSQLSFRWIFWTLSVLFLAISCITLALDHNSCIAAN